MPQTALPCDLIGRSTTLALLKTIPPAASFVALSAVRSGPKESERFFTSFRMTAWFTDPSPISRKCVF